MCSGPDNTEYPCAVTILSGTAVERPVSEDLLMGAARDKRRSAFGLAEAVAAALTGLSLALPWINAKGPLGPVLGLTASALTVLASVTLARGSRELARTLRESCSVSGLQQHYIESVQVVKGGLISEVLIKFGRGRKVTVRVSSRALRRLGLGAYLEPP